MTELLYMAVCGAAGAIAKDFIEDGFLEIPKRKGHKLYLGCLGSIMAGLILGYLTDNNPITAFLAGYTGFSILDEVRGINTKLLKKQEEDKLNDPCNGNSGTINASGQIQASD